MNCAKSSAEKNRPYYSTRYYDLQVTEIMSEKSNNHSLKYPKLLHEKACCSTFTRSTDVFARNMSLAYFYKNFL